MLNSLRSALVWLLLLAIPTQGIAAATMLHCGPVHPGVALETAAAAAIAPVAISTNHAPKHVHTGQADHGSHHHAAATGQYGASDAIPDQISPLGSHEHSPSTKCSVCALCCNAAAVVSSPLVISPQGVALAPIVTVPESPISFVTDGPRRPPRSFLA